jgi:two-component system, OmpR family, phosphate regulon sensor histidine kinase PhoR
VPSLSAIIQTNSARIAARSEIIVVCTVGILALVVLTALNWSAGLMAWLAMFAYALLRRPDEQSGLGISKPGVTRTDIRDAVSQALVTAIPDPAWTLDRSGIVLQANAPARGIFASLRSGIPVSSVVRSPDLIEAVERALATGTVQSSMLHERVPIERRLAVTVAPLPSAGGHDRVPALLVTLRDLTEQDRLAQMRADFVANASHELRTPLASLRGFVETLQGPARNDAVARERFLGIMSKQAERMTRLIDDLLSLSRVEMRQHLAPTDIVDLVEIAQLSIQALEPQAEKASIKLSFAADQPSLLARGDRDELLQVFQNLIQNAIKYGREGGRVDVRIKRRDAAAGKPPRIGIAVSDDGPGIDVEHIPRLTERFYRVNAPQSRDKGGTGLGLAIVKHIMGRHGGDLLIASKSGEGSTFTATLNEYVTVNKK